MSPRASNISTESCHEHGIEYEADPKHVTAILKEMGMKSSTTVNTPGNSEKLADDDYDLKKEDGCRLRRIIAICNYIAQDWPDIGFCVKECARTMAALCARDPQMPQETSSISSWSTLYAHRL